MTRPHLKAEETQCVRRLLATLPDGDRWSLDAGETPDFVLSRGETKVGVEVTRLTDNGIGAAVAARNRLRKAITSRLRASGDRAHVHVRLSEGSAVLLQSRAECARYGDMVHRLVTDASVRPRRYSSEDLVGFGGELLNAVYVRDGSVVTVSLHVRGRGEAFVQRRIDEKNQKLSQYRSRVGAGEVWLLLVAGADVAGAVWSDVVDGSTYVSEFDRIFCLDIAEDRVFEVSHRRPAE